MSAYRCELFREFQIDFECFVCFAIQVGNAELYNSYLQSLKSSIPNRGLEVFWDLLVQGMISLFISSSLKLFLSWDKTTFFCIVL